MEDGQNPALIEAMRVLRAQGEDSTAILRMLASQGLSYIDFFRYFKEAFGLSLRQLACIGGWYLDGTGELSDEQLNELLERAFQEKAAAD